MQYNRDYYTNQANFIIESQKSKYRVQVIKQPLKTKIQDVRIEDLSWILKLETIIARICSDADIKTQLMGLCDYLRYCNTDLLSEINQSAIKYITTELLNLEVNFHVSSEIPSLLKSQERILEICKLKNSNIYVNGAGAKYINSDFFQQNQIEVLQLNFSQMDLGKILGMDPDVSIISIIAKCGTKYVKDKISELVHVLD